MARTAVLFVALTILALLSSWVADLLTPRTPLERTERHTPDYYLVGVGARAMDERGALQHRMRAARLVHFADDDSSELEQPRFYALGSAGARWEVASERGQSSGDGKVVHLIGTVTMNELGDRHGELRTRDLLLRPREDYVETAAPVAYRDATSHIDATGLRGHLSEGGTLQLLADVRGTHVPNTD